MIRIWHTVPRCCRNRQRGGLPSGRQYVAKVAEIQKPLANKRFFLLQIISRRIAFGKWLTHNADTSVPQRILRQLWFYQFLQCRVAA